LLTALRAANRPRYVAVEDQHEPWPDAEQNRALALLRARYVGGELSLQEYEAALDRVLRATPPPSASSAALRLRPQQGSDLSVALGAGAALLLTTGVLLARALRRPLGAPLPQRHSARTAQAVLVVEVFTARWHAAATRY
jgi:hypothetical protein